MRALVWLLLLALGAAAAATLLGANDALVSVFYGSTRIDLSFNLFLLLLLALVLGAYLVLHAVVTVLRLPGQAREWRDGKRESAAHAALRESLTELLGGRYTRAQRAAELARALAAGTTALGGDRSFSALAQLLGAWASHRLQDRTGRDTRLAAALADARSAQQQPQADAAELLAAEWALDDGDAERSAAMLAELPAGTARRTHALRLRLQTQRRLGQPLDALATARLLAKHQGFSKVAAQALLRTLVQRALDAAYDEEQLRRTASAFDSANWRDPHIAALAARRAASLGLPALGREWLAPRWAQLGQVDADGRAAVAQALMACLPGLEASWLPLLDAALAQHGHEAAVQAAVGLAWAERGLWGKAQRPLQQAGADARLGAPLRRQALRVLARIARERGDEEAAQAAEQRAAAID